MFCHITLTVSYLFYVVQKQPKSLPNTTLLTLINYKLIIAQHFRGQYISSWSLILYIVFHATCHVIINITFSFFRCFLFVCLFEEVISPSRLFLILLVLYLLVLLPLLKRQVSFAGHRSQVTGHCFSNTESIPNTYN